MGWEYGEERLYILVPFVNTHILRYLRNREFPLHTNSTFFDPKIFYNLLNLGCANVCQDMRWANFSLKRREGGPCPQHNLLIEFPTMSFDNILSNVTNPILCTSIWWNADSWITQNIHFVFRIEIRGIKLIKWLMQIAMRVNFRSTPSIRITFIKI